MPKLSAGLLLYRRSREIEVLLVHPGGPFWAKRDLGAWSIPKGEYVAGEDPETVARREFEEETGTRPADGPVVPLGSTVQAGGKRVMAFALEDSFDPDTLRSTMVEIAWPPRSGRRLSVPEVDRAEWFLPEAARTKLVLAQRAFVDRLLDRLRPG